MLGINGKKALITGGSRGIGLAIVRSFANLGTSVAFTGTNQEKLTNLEQELSNEFKNSKFLGIACNMSDKESVLKLVPTVVEKFGGLDVLVCNAGITKDGLAMRMKDEDFAEVIDINLKANFTLNREAVKVMMKQRWGRIINMASIVGLTGNAGQANYAASKAGLIAMTKSIAQEVASRNITVNAIAPGFIRTDMTDAIPEAAKQAILTKIPMASYGSAEDIAGGVLYLASDYGKYITGEVLNINGGMAMNG